MSQTCECYKKLKYAEYCYNLENPQETEQVEETLELRTSESGEQEKAVYLPGVIRIKDSVFEYPDACNSDLARLFPEMAEIITGVDDYELNILSFWILDVFLEGLRTAQLAGMSQRNQKAALHWMAYVYNVMQGTGSKLTRRDLFLKLKLILLAPPDEDDDDDVKDQNDSAYNIKEKNVEEDTVRQWTVPFPPVWRADNDQISGETAEEINITDEDEDDELVEPEQNLRDMETILEIIYHIYGRLWSFFLIRTSLRSTPNVEIVDLPLKLNVPKQVLKYEEAMQMKSDLGGGRASEEVVDDPKNEYILPLQAAEGVETLLRDLFALPSHESIVSERDKGKQEKKKK